MKIVKKSLQKTATKAIKAKAERLPPLAKLKEDELELWEVRSEIGALACTWNLKFYPDIIENIPFLYMDGQVVWAGYVPPAIQYVANAVCDAEGNSIIATHADRADVQTSIYGSRRRTAADRKLER